MRILGDQRYDELLETRATRPDEVWERAAARIRRPRVRDDGRLMIVALDHPARRILGVGDDPSAMADRRDALERCIRALRRPGVDGLLATPDVVEDLLLLGELDDKVVIGSMNRGGLSGSAWELDDRFTAYSPEVIDGLGLDGGKMLLRLDYDDPATIETLSACANAVTALAARGLMAMVEPLPVKRTSQGRVAVSTDVGAQVEAVAIASALGAPSMHTWLKLPASTDPARMMAATTLPTLLLGGDPAAGSAGLHERWRQALAIPHVRGLTVGRSLLYPADGDVERWVDEAATLVHS